MTVLSCVESDKVNDKALRREAQVSGDCLSTQYRCNVNWSEAVKPAQHSSQSMGQLKQTSTPQLQKLVYGKRLHPP